MRAKRANRLEALDNSWRLREAVTKVLMVATALALVAGLTLVYRQFHSPAGIFRPGYEGRIVNKHVTSRETKEGSWALRQLLVEGQDGARFEVAVGPEVYGRAEVGMWVKVRNAQVELTRPAAHSPAVEPAK